MPVHTRRLVGRRVHRRGVSRIIGQTADLIGEGHAQVEAPEIDARAETAVEIGNRVAAEIVRCLGIFSRRDALARRVTLVVGFVHVPHRKALVRNPGIFSHVESIHRQSFSEESGAVHVTGVAIALLGPPFRRQHGDLVAQVRHVEIDVPLDMLPPDRRKVQLDFDAAVAHVAHVGVVGRIAQRRSYRERQQHVGRLAEEIFDASGNRTAQEAELHTGVEVGVGLPGEVAQAVILIGAAGVSVVFLGVGHPVQCIIGIEVLYCGLAGAIAPHILISHVAAVVIFVDMLLLLHVLAAGIGVLHLQQLADGIVVVVLHPAVRILHLHRAAHAVVSVGGGTAIVLIRDGRVFCLFSQVRTIIFNNPDLSNIPRYTS